MKNPIHPDIRAFYENNGYMIRSEASFVEPEDRYWDAYVPGRENEYLWIGTENCHINKIIYRFDDREISEEEMLQVARMSAFI